MALNDIDHIHWDILPLETETFEPYGPYNGWLDIHVSSELARNGRGTLVPMSGHRYWPTCIKLTYYERRGIEGLTEIHEPSVDLFTAGLTAELARELAAKLIEAADRADALDKPCCDPCGHWAPCDCGSQMAAEP